MNLDPFGRFIINPGEKVTITVTKAKDIYLATFSALSAGVVWNTINMVTQLCEERTFHAPAGHGTGFSFNIAFNSRPDATGAQDMTDKYTVQIMGDQSGGTPNTPSDSVIPPPIKNQGYTFVTS